tara:strand:+ start:97 stop:462 length:366 start_codon:yes stop_codon:yes gene_type:complete
MKHKLSYWTYTKSQRHEYPDPRIAIARHIGWQKYTGDETSFSVPEPDNYNRAVFTDTAVECPFIENQVIYKDSVRNGWVCVMLVADEQTGEYTAWQERLAPRAHWHHIRAPKIKKSRCIPL